MEVAGLKEIVFKILSYLKKGGVYIFFFTILSFLFILSQNYLNIVKYNYYVLSFIFLLILCAWSIIIVDGFYNIKDYIIKKIKIKKEQIRKNTEYKKNISKLFSELSLTEKRCVYFMYINGIDKLLFRIDNEILNILSEKNIISKEKRYNPYYNSYKHSRFINYLNGYKFSIDDEFLKTEIYKIDTEIKEDDIKSFYGLYYLENVNEYNDISEKFICMGDINNFNINYKL